MNCPHCHSTQTTKLPRTTELGYAVFRCAGCDRTFNERTGTPFNYREVPTDIVFQVLLCRVWYKLSYRDVAEIFLLRGFEFTHETVRDWEERFTPIFADELRAKRQGQASKTWYVDETYVKVKGKWCYLYRALDQVGNRVDSRLSEQRDRVAAKAFFAQTQDVAESPKWVVTDGLRRYPRAIAEVLGPEVEHAAVSCTANRIEQDHRGIKHRYYPTLGFHTFEAGPRFCRVVEDVRNFLRLRRWMGEVVSLVERRAPFLQRVEELHSLFAPA